MSVSKQRMSRVRESFGMAAAAALILVPAADAWALLDDKLEIFGMETVTRDSNVFRLSRDRDAAAAIGSSEKGDTYTTTSVGANLDLPVSRQRFQAGVRLNQTHFRRFSDLNYLGHDGRALWLWQAGNDLNGQLGYTETKALATFTSFSDQRRIADPVATRRAFGNATYAISPSWQVQGGLAEQTQRNGNVLREENDVDITSSDMLFSYVSPAANRIGIAVRQDNGRYLHPQTVGALSFDNRYVQRGLGVVTDWTLTGKSHLAARADRVRRSYDQLSQRDFNGTTYRATYDWQATGKLALTGVLQRDISPAEDIQTSFVLVNGIALRPSFALTDKIRLTANADFSTREYLGDPGLALGTTTGRKDRVRTLGALVSYRPLRSLTMELSGQRESRSSNQALSDYAANILSINARLAF